MTLTITRPDDWHTHLRDDEALSLTVSDTARYIGRAVVMPNLTPPVTTTEQALAYQARIHSAMPAARSFEAVMVLYLTNNTRPSEIEQAAKSGAVKACKLYPAGATTNSDAGVTDIKAMYPVFEAMAKHGLKLLVHGEVTDPEIDIFDREAQFLNLFLSDIIEAFPTLKIVLEHITTEEAVDFILAAPDNVAATITAHHLLFNRNHMLAGGIRPHFYCLPILKRNRHQKALIKAATSGSAKFFAGTDSAPHATTAKIAPCGCAGCYTAFAAIELYAMAFEAADALDKLEGFCSHYGADFYNMKRNTDTITLEKKSWLAPSTLTFGSTQLTPILADEAITWSVK